MNAPEPTFRVVLPDLSWRCDACGQLIPPGEPMIASDGSRLTHEVCPTPWTPEVITGTGPSRGRGRQPALPFLTAVPDEETP